jgi:membrane-bound lytic murein transglycosylase A
VRPLARILALAVLLAATPGFASPGALRRVDQPEGIALLDDGDLESLRQALGRNLAWLGAQAPARRLTFGPRAVTVAAQRQALERLLGLLADDPAPEVLEARVLAAFDLLESVGRADGEVLVTGYHEPIIEASLVPGPEYRVPIHAVPRDPGAQRWPRAAIDAGRLGEAGRILAWARDPVDVFFLEIEGSGTLRLPDGGEIRVGYAATNGRPYRSIGRLLIDEGRIPEETLTMPAIRDWLLANPAERNRVFHHNEAVVFFRRLGGSPVGSLGVPVTPGRTIATDARVFPPGALAFVRAERPVRQPDGTVVWRPVSRFVVNQDTGGAIRGPGRVDLFWGRGDEAALAAGLMKERGRLFFLAPR